MRVVVTGATGNVGSSLLPVLADDPGVEAIAGLARRRPDIGLAKTTWVAADVARDDLVPVFRGADAVVHLAWVIQPSRRPDLLREINVTGTGRVLQAVAEAGVPVLVYASSVGAYSPGPKDRRVREDWPTEGIPSAFYSRHKAVVERMLDRFEEERPEVRVVRLRPSLIFKREAATGIRRLFLGPLAPTGLLRPSLVPLVPFHRRLLFQAVHTRDVAEAYRLALMGDARGAFNVAGEPVLGPEDLASLLQARPVSVTPDLLRKAVTSSWRLHLQPTPPGWLDMGVSSPLLDTTRARQELGWAPATTSREALSELLDGLREGADHPTPPLSAASSGPGRLNELLTGIGWGSTPSARR